MLDVRKQLSNSVAFVKIMILSILGSLVVPGHAAVEVLMQSEKSWDGGSFSYPDGKAQISSVKLSLQAGKDAPFHCHPIPTMGYISKGEVLLQTLDGKEKTYRAGDTVVEAMKTVHRGKTEAGDAEVIVFYAGAQDIPLTVFPDDEENFAKYCQ